MNYDQSIIDRIDALHEEAEDLAALAIRVTDSERASQLRAHADLKVRQAARLRQEAGL